MGRGYIYFFKLKLNVSVNMSYIMIQIFEQVSPNQLVKDL